MDLDELGEPAKAAGLGLAVLALNLAATTAAISGQFCANCT